MLQKFALAILGALAGANTHKDDTLGIFGSDIEWKTGYVQVDPENGDELFYWLIRS